MKIDEYECIKIEKKRIDGAPTNYYKVDKKALYDMLKSKGYINEKYDTVEQVEDNNDLEYGLTNDDNEKDKIIQTQQNKIDELMKQIEELKAQMNNNKDKQIDDEIDNHSIDLDISDIEEPEPEPPKKKVIKVVKKVVKKKVSNDEFVLVV
jgi:predicted ATP-binding protein involved in virulence